MKNLVLGSIFILISLYVLFFNIKDFGILISFLAVFIPIIFLFYQVINGKHLFFEASLLVFYYMFFFLAPILQLSYGFLPNTMTIKQDLVLKANLFSSIFLTIFIIVRFFVLNNLNLKTNFQFKIKNLNFIVLTYLLVFLLVLIWDRNYLLNIILYGYKNNAINQPIRLIINQYIYIFPLFLLTFFIYKSKKERAITTKSLLIIFLSLICVLLVKNFFTGNRGTIGPIYLSIIVFLFINKFNSSRYFYFLLITMIFLYPLGDIFVHNNYTIINYLNGDVDIAKEYLDTLKIQLTRLDYDAWSNFLATIEYVNFHGVSYGKQIIGTIFFFIPREIWEAKPVGTGEVIGRYLMSNYSMWFYNLSNPIPSEGYIDFGLFGIVSYAVALALLSKLTYNFIVSNSYMKFIGIFMSLQLLLFLRGDMISSGPYFLAPLLALFITPWILDKVISIIKR